MKRSFFKNVFFVLAAVICLGAIGGGSAYATTIAGLRSPVVLTSITPVTTTVKIYVEGSSTLYIKKDKELLFSKYYKNEGVKTITIPKQKVNSKLKFYVKGKRNGNSYTSDKTKLVLTDYKPTYTDTQIEY